MKRREFMQAAVAGSVIGAASSSAAPQGSSGFIALEWYHCRRDQDVQRLQSYLSKSVVPAYTRAGVKPVGAFQPQVGPDSPSFLLVTAYPSLASLQDAYSKLAEDASYVADQKAFDEKWELAYDRIECSLLRAFKTTPGIEVPKVEPGKTNLFELRIYESRNLQGHIKKVSMFDDGEIDLFRRVGISPVFFGSTLFGPNMPNLAYMVSFPSAEARAQSWSAFGQSPEWKKMSTAPGMTDRELVCRISNQFMTPLPFSEIK